MKTISIVSLALLASILSSVAAMNDAESALRGLKGKRGGRGRGNNDFVDLTCDASNACDLRNGEAGTWACRTRTDSTTGEDTSEAKCIPADKARATDVCGCCQDDTGADLECPFQPDYLTLECTEDTQPVDDPDRYRRGGKFRDTSEYQYVCRNLFDAFTGIAQLTTVHIPANRALDGDTCGCCDEDCTMDKARPEFVEKSCEADDFVACEKSGWRGGEGFYVCRERFDRLGLEESTFKSICITADRALETDICGECPE